MKWWMRRPVYKGTTWIRLIPLGKFKLLPNQAKETWLESHWKNVKREIPCQTIL